MVATMKLVQNDMYSELTEKRETAFNWYTTSNEFTIDSEFLHEKLQVTNQIDSLESFVDIFSVEYKPKILLLLKNTASGSNPDPIKVSVTGYKGNTTMCLVSARKITESFVAGALIPLFASPAPEDLGDFFNQIFENNHHGMIITDEDTRIVACNSCFEASSGYQMSELVGKKTSIFNAQKHGDNYFREMWQKVNRQGYWSGLILSKRKSGAIAPQELLIQKITSKQGLVYFLGTTLDLSDKLYRVAGMEHGGIELLTQLPGEDDFYLKVKESLNTRKESQGMLVLSFVPSFNDESEFDQKKQLASALAYHEDNFCAGFLKKTVFTMEITYERTETKPHSLSIFEAIKERFNKVKARVDADVYRKISECTIGVSVLGLDANNAQRLVSHSLQAMYEKHTSNNSNICFFNRTLHNKIKHRESLEEVVRESIASKKMEVYFQPIICAREWKVKKLEALCRFRDNDGEILNTQEIVRIAEDLGLITQLDLAIADKAISYRPLLIQKYGKAVELTINVSLNSQKSKKEVFSDVFSLLRQHAEHLPYITVELTESAYFDSKHKDSDILFKLRNKGVKIAIDDFGTGYSSFSYLKDGAFDLLKVDRDFVKEISFGSHNYYIVKMITHLAHTLGVKVVAEGVETIQELTILHDLKVDFMQGFYFEKPTQVENLPTNIEIRNKLNELQDLTDEPIELVECPPMLSPHSTLNDVKALFDSCSVNALPVIVEKTCVGIVTRECFNLHATPSLGTDRETMQDYRSLSRSVNGMMSTMITQVHETINDGEIHEKIRNSNPFPWVVISDDGEYRGLIDSSNIIRYLNEK
ncbi:EAL domain-containing protein [Vibrio sp. HN007]|uniref:sensor domain-containing phosphodiesterase n=1 Tax=Vibrio iocasae TaxID=3098914 RepID=UPI0035D4570C